MTIDNKNPLDIAREALRRLAVAKIPPTPDQYRAVYCEIAQIKAEDPFPLRPLRQMVAGLPRETGEQLRLAQTFSRAVEQESWSQFSQAMHGVFEERAVDKRNWSGLAADLIRQLEMPHTELTYDHKRLALFQAFEEAKGSNSMLYAHLQALIKNWSQLPQDGSLGVIPVHAAGPASESSGRDDPAVPAENDHDLREIYEGLKRVVELLFRNIELLADDRWLHGQIGAVLALFTRPLDLDLLTELQDKLQAVIAQQLNLKRSIGEAEERLKSMLAGFIDHLADFGATTNQYHEQLGVCAERIAKARNLAEISDVISNVLQQTQTMRDTTARSQDDLLDLQRRVEDANEQIACLQRQLNEVSTQVRLDPLTGALNRKGMDEVLEREIARAMRQGSQLALALLDIDNFKKLNDTEGHYAGDQALVHLSKVVRDCLRPQDSLARYGGEEFLILLPDTRLDVATDILVRLQRELTRKLFLHDNRRILITFSAGVTEYRIGEPAMDAVNRADTALYEAKHTGKNRVCTA